MKNRQIIFLDEHLSPQARETEVLEILQFLHENPEISVQIVGSDEAFLKSLKPRFENKLAVLLLKI